MADKQIHLAGGKAASTKGPAFHLIPSKALEAVADRFELGLVKHGDKAWNAMSNNQQVLEDKEFLLVRISHTMHHLLKLRDQLLRGQTAGEESMSDNAAAVAWGGICLTEATVRAAQRVPYTVAKEAEKASVKIVASWLHIEAGKTYVCENGLLTGEMRRTADVYFVGRLPNVRWMSNGVPCKIDTCMTTEELAGYKIVSEQLADA